MVLSKDALANVFVSFGLKRTCTFLFLVNIVRHW